MAIGHWVLAARPKTLVAAAAPVLVGAGLAQHHGAFAALPILAALVGALLIQIGTNLANDYYDFVRGADTHERIGPVRVTQAGLVAPDVVRRAMVLVLASALVPGAYLVAVAGWPIVWIGLVSIACAVLYTGGPAPLAYHGLGDLFVFVFFGLVAVGGTYYVQAGAWPIDAWLAGTGVGALSTAVLVVNNLRDIGTDAAAGKRTLAVRIGRTGTRVEYALLLMVAALVPVAGVAALGWPASALAALIALFFGIAPARTVFMHRDPRELMAALGGTARLLAVYGVALALGLALA
ncbi:MAG: 1,4-dihydroxy-2-naphthoate polyprenyltransferase [Gemmatimonadales bacterium]